MERMAYSTVWERTLLTLALMSPLRYSSAKVERIRMGSLYNSSIGSRAMLAQKAGHISQWVYAEEEFEVEINLAMVSVPERKLHRKRCFWMGSTCAMTVSGGNGCQSGATIRHQ